MKIKTIDVQAKQWRDRTYGNSYFAAQVTINFGTKTEKTFYVPFQYGYGSQYEWAAKQVLQNAGLLPADINGAVSRIARENNIILRTSLQENCKKSDAKAFGSN